jgi:Spo0E like sporulation regulatory protein.
MGISKKVEEIRDELNTLIKNKEVITDDREILELSIKLDNLINEYVNKEGVDMQLTFKK